MIIPFLTKGIIIGKEGNYHCQWKERSHHLMSASSIDNDKERCERSFHLMKLLPEPSYRTSAVLNVCSYATS